MSPIEFAYWLQGAMELFPNVQIEGLTGQQVQVIQDHLNLVLKKVTPERLVDAPASDGEHASLRSGVFSTASSPEWGNWGDDATDVFC